MIGYSLLLMAICAGFSFGYVHKMIYIPTDVNLTFTLLQENIFIYKLSVLSWVFIFILDLLVSFGIYKIYKDTNIKFAKITTLLRVLYSIILGIAIFQLILPIVNNFINKKSIVYFESFTSIWTFGLIIFGFHLLTLGQLGFKSDFTNNIWSFLLALAGLSYILISTLKYFFPDLNEMTSSIEKILMAPMTIGELGFGIWIMIKSHRLHEDFS